MAGSYNHCITNKGNLLSPDRLAGMLDYSDTGDVYEAIEEMYGMIWWLAAMASDSKSMAAEDLVETARQNYRVGLAVAKQNKKKGKRP